MSYLDQYCERAGDAGLWAEPINVVSNIAFMIVAVIAFITWARHPKTSIRNSMDIVILIVVLFSIGIGSGAWHLFADSHTLLMDVIPIVIFMNIFLIAAAMRLLGLKWWGAVLLFGIFQLLNIASEVYLPRDFLNGTIMYIPAYSILLCIVVWLKKSHAIGSRLVLQALILWTVSLVFRTIDMEICSLLPIGTHFLWHLLNALVLYKLLGALILTQAVKLNG